MIHVIRPPVLPAVEAALNKLSKGETELHWARLHYQKVPPPTKAYGFDRYREHEVQEALRGLFHGKCAYCECDYAAPDALNVEHYRPKGGVNEWEDHPGYWWLAAKWNNLLPSCPACNQHRYQFRFVEGLSWAELEKSRAQEPTLTSGKGNSFPTRNKYWVHQEGIPEAGEDPLLINPCETNPDDYLEWVFEWDKTSLLWLADRVTPLIKPRKHGTDEDTYGATSIATYGLDRIELIRARTELVKYMQMTSERIVDLMVEMSRDPALVTSANQAKLEKQRQQLNYFTRPGGVFRGTAKAFVKLFEVELHRYLESLIVPPPAGG
jgi:hypothetical protein